MKILVISLAGIGDTLLATGVLRELREAFPEAEIHALVHWAGAKDLLEANPRVNVVHQKNLISVGGWNALRYLWGLRRHRYDVSINTHAQGRIHYRVAAWLAGAPIRLTHQYESFAWLNRWLVTRVLAQDYAVHSVENNRRLAALLGRPFGVQAASPEVFLRPQDEAFARDFSASHDLAAHPVLGIHVGSGETKNLRLKRWPEPHYIRLLERIVAERPEARVLLFGGPSEVEPHARILAAVRSSAILTPQTRNLLQAAALMRHCDAFLSVDTALMHLAAAMEVPNQIVIEAPTLNATNMPFGNPCRVIRNPVVNGRNLEFYRYDGKPIRGSAAELERCMASVTVEAVWEVAAAALTSRLYANRIEP